MSERPKRNPHPSTKYVGWYGQRMLTASREKSYKKENDIDKEITKKVESWFVSNQDHEDKLQLGDPVTTVPLMHNGKKPTVTDQLNVEKMQLQQNEELTSQTADHQDMIQLNQNEELTEKTANHQDIMQLNQNEEFTEIIKI